MSWQIVLDDGSKHDVEHQISYKIGNGKEMKSGTLDGDADVLFTAFENKNVFLESPTGDTIPIHVTFEGNVFKMHPRAL
ncbi:hypothetical protein [Agrobacterium tumefaciens]|uniref:hypothetical protein n=1 Tax=Agrobacterium tumefaciens TaxID=358 RepID=UPI0015747479|nr:hypothetical protein [Agrobacterium tumefaciens]NTD88653.1 hypothetical protein [Agrobacterium tumefaciens]NTD91382.1 hypothetical protein [Agrobacterium tumefaciens]NTD98829.1 hypothetical protein [Agrobacterium tumefaciens]NTE12210.1 hypothetical protein [Agrobacterium tumefaciens]NTE20287.1 hypothetical protein [Agrobacterium tumefaciens]